ncbi:11519_t:CDS:1, partial [Scutellospora calospora]
TPQEISTEISNQLPFALSIQKRSQTKEIVNTLRQIFIFTTLPMTYFITLPELPANPDDLILEGKDFFSITS